jgi:fumarate reductase subunit C
MSAMRRHTYVRPMDGWWRRDPFFLRYMAREATAVFVVIYAAILLVTVLRLAEGRAAFDAWMATLGSPSGIVLHSMLLAAFAYHTWSWFAIMPKTMPPVSIAGRRVAPGLITAAGVAFSVMMSAALVAIAWSFAR